MQHLQIINITPEELQRMITTATEIAVHTAIEALNKVKQDPNEDITVAEIAKLWGCSKQTIYRRIKAHKVPSVRLGRDAAIKRRWLETIKKPITTEK